MAVPIISVLFSTYLRVHGPGLNFIDVSLLTTLGLIILGCFISTTSKKPSIERIR